ncbi:DUF1631 family protein [Rhodoferax sp. TBRC 17198]|uniref:DUF1631 family protein n=1 Tax=Rhodoferax potami TaxID=3068338 RepID=UPI0028BF4DB9|nr:DUF1631 family protein [Rhodoferax sp. TBRC 17198]MDT7521257.1 DUF1631 family protein [Rhodoferax sp. TBRC 17198]
MQNRHSPPPPLFQATVKEAAAAGPALMAKLVAALRRDLHLREGAARDFREREVHADSLRQLFAHEAILEKGFEAALMEQFIKPVDTPRTSMPSIADVQFDQLELMDELQVQESVNMARAQQMVMLAAEASLSELNALMCAALGLPTVRPERNPLRPEAYIQALRSTVERTPAPSSMRLDWLTVMGTALGSELQALYRDLVVRLRAQGVVAASYAVSQSATPGVGAAGFKRAEGAGSAQMETTRYGAPGSAEREALIAQELSRPKPVVDPGLLTLDRLRLLLAGELDSAGTTHRVAAFAKQFERDFESPQAGYRAHEAEPTDFAATVPAAFEALAEMRQVDRVVQRLEQRRSATPEIRAGVDGDVREKIRRTVNGVAQALSLEVVSLMVDNIARDPRLLESVQGLVRGLEPALMRLALADPRFFTDKEHAARMLVQELTHRSLAFAKVGSPGFLAYLDEAREAIAPLMDEHAGPENFERVLSHLQSLWDDEASKQAALRAQAVRALEKAEQRNLLAEKIAREIDGHRDANKVPEVVLHFLCGPWAQVVAQARLAGGSRSAAADRYQALIAALLWSTHPDLAPKNIPKLTKLVPLLLGTLRDGLETIQYPATKVGAFFEALMGLHQAAFRAVHRDPWTRSKEAPETPARAVALAVPHRPVEDGDPWVAPSEASESNLLELDDASSASSTAPESSTSTAQEAEVPVSGNGAGSLPLGSWVELQSNDDWVRTQLTWASPHGTLFLFTSASGSTQSMTRRTHDKLVAAGQLRVISAQTVLDAALDAVAQQAMKNSVIAKL